jgi:hypothetical protein
MRVRVCECVHVFADMNLAMGVPKCTTECKRRVTRLTNGTNGADPMASCEASNYAHRRDALTTMRFLWARRPGFYHAAASRRGLKHDYISGCIGRT